MEQAFQILICMNVCEPLEIKCNFQQPSSSESPLLHCQFGPVYLLQVSKMMMGNIASWHNLALKIIKEIAKVKKILKGSLASQEWTR